MSKPGKIILSGGLILGSAAYALWQQQQTVPPPIMRQVAEKVRHTALQPGPLPAPTPAPMPAVADAAPAPPPKAEPKIARTAPQIQPQQYIAPQEDAPPPPEPPPPDPLNAVQLAPPPPATTGRYLDGEFIGNSVDDEWGPVQVKVVVRNGDIADVICIEYPFHRRRSQEISEWAIPTLVEETIKAQSAKIDWVTQASFTSDQFQKSLASALGRARKASAT